MPAITWRWGWPLGRSLWVHKRWFVSCVAIMVLGAMRCSGQTAQGDSENDNLLMSAETATTWVDGAVNVVMLDGPVTLDLDRTKMTADRAVGWLAPKEGAVLQGRTAAERVGR